MSNKTVEYLMQKGEVKMEWLPIGEVKEHPQNPKYITHEELESLKRSITEFPEMMLIRSGVVDSDGFLIAGNQRLKACKALGWDKFPVRRATDLTPAQLKEFMIKDNVQWGEWNHDLLKEDWNVDELKGWGLELGEMPEIDEADLPPTSQSRMSHQKQIRLNYSEDQAEKVKKELAKIADTPELAVLILLKLTKTPEKGKQGPKRAHGKEGSKVDAGDTSDPDVGNK